MDKLIDILQIAPQSRALMRVYKNYICLNATAAKLLRLDEKSLICIKRRESFPSLYISNAKGMRFSYACKKKGFRYLINNAKLARAVADNLEGAGSYRICEEESWSDGENIYYNIFFKKYEG